MRHFEAVQNNCTKRCIAAESFMWLIGTLLVFCHGSFGTPTHFKVVLQSRGRGHASFMQILLQQKQHDGPMIVVFKWRNTFRSAEAGVCWPEFCLQTNTHVNTHTHPHAEADTQHINAATWTHFIQTHKKRHFPAGFYLQD